MADKNRLEPKFGAFVAFSITPHFEVLSGRIPSIESLSLLKCFSIEYMSIFNSKIEDFSVNIDKPVYHEQWYAGTYLHMGVFPLRVKNLCVDQIKEERQKQYELIKHNRIKRIHYFLGISGYYLIPIYISFGFDDDVIDWVHNRPKKYKTSIWHEAVLYSTANNSAEMNMKWGNYGSAYRPILSVFIDRFLHEIAVTRGYGQLEKFCGETLKIKNRAN